LQLQVVNSPFNNEQVGLLNQLLPSLTEQQQIWLSGYLTALQRVPAQGSAGIAVLEAPSAASVPVSREVTVLFGSQTGNSQRLANKLSQKLSEKGYQVALSSMRDFKPNSLKKVSNLLIIASTHGEGEPPDNAIAFYEFLHSKRAPQLEGLRFSVLALGDTSYELFCQTGKDFDRRLEELGGTRISPRVDCDVDYDEPAAEWMESVLKSIGGEAGVSSSSAPLSTQGAAVSGAATGQQEYSRTFPFRAEVLQNINLNGRGADRETRHLELSLEGSSLKFEPGDCVGIYPENHPELVDAIIAELGWNPEEQVVINKQGEQSSLRDALLRSFEITVLTKPLLEQAAKFSANSGLLNLLEPGQEQNLREYIRSRDLLDLVQDFAPWKATAGEFVSILRKLPARLYSISSSYQANPDEVHVTIRAVRYEAHGRQRYGVCSIHCAERLEPGDTVMIYIHQNPNFKMPEDPETPIIMIGPGTGVAPFRAFMEEREETGAEGPAWLFFGDRHFQTDFLYQVEWQRWLKDGVLTKLDVAFSRDSAEKVYVQHRMLEKSKELYQWLQDGAIIYVCGDEKHMAHDVHAALKTIVEREGGLGPAEADAYLSELQLQKRYQRDVY
jgi:sulfite reductase (NADPH) flavoprotein alpha-component